MRKWCAEILGVLLTLFRGIARKHKTSESARRSLSTDTNLGLSNYVIIVIPYRPTMSCHTTYILYFILLTSERGTDFLFCYCVPGFTCTPPCITAQECPPTPDPLTKTLLLAATLATEPAAHSAAVHWCSTTTLVTGQGGNHTYLIKPDTL